MKETVTPTVTPKTRAPRTPRTLSDIEMEAKRQYEDAKFLTKITPQIIAMGPWGRAKLTALVAEFKDLAVQE